MFVYPKKKKKKVRLTYLNWFLIFFILLDDNVTYALSVNM